MRVIGGTLRGRKLSAFKGTRIRPTSDRLREAVFNILAPLPPLSKTLDLYAGTGALGIEAISRGAKEAHFVESNSKAADIIKKNIEGLGLDERAKIFIESVDGFLDSAALQSRSYDLIFIDPPYSAGLSVQTLEKICALNILKEGAKVVVETGKREPIGNDILERGFTGLEQIDFRKYGDSLIYIFKRKD